MLPCNNIPTSNLKHVQSLPGYIYSFSKDIAFIPDVIPFCFWIARFDLPGVCRTSDGVFFSSGNVLFPFYGILSVANDIFFPLIRQSYPGKDPFCRARREKNIL
jgi:hypothetical protein